MHAVPCELWRACFSPGKNWPYHGPRAIVEGPGLMYGHVLGEVLEASVRAGILHAANDRRNAAQRLAEAILLNAVRVMPPYLR